MVKGPCNACASIFASSIPRPLTSLPRLRLPSPSTQLLPNPPPIPPDSPLSACASSQHVPPPPPCPAPPSLPLSASVRSSYTPVACGQRRDRRRQDACADAVRVAVAETTVAHAGTQSARSKPRGGGERAHAAAQRAPEGRPSEPRGARQPDERSGGSAPPRRPGAKTPWRTTKKPTKRGASDAEDAGAARDRDLHALARLRERAAAPARARGVGGARGGGRGSG